MYAEEYSLCKKYTLHTCNTLEIKSGWKHNKMVAVSSLSAEIIGDFPFLCFVYLDILKHMFTCVINRLLQKGK